MADKSAGEGPGTAPGTAPAFAVETIGLNKTYAGRHGQPPKPALIDVSLQIPRGSLFGLLGPNGAGKSTLINILAGLVIKTSGTARIWGFDIDENERQARSAIGVVPQELNIDPFFTPFELLELQAGLYGVPKARRRTAEVLAALRLSDKAHAYARTLSGGMRRRLLVAKALVHSPPVLVLDEPTAGVDVELRQQLWAHVRELNRSGVTVLLTTHYLEEAEKLCDRIAIIHLGRLVCCEETGTLLGRIDTKEMWITLQDDLSALPPQLSRFDAEIRPPRRIRIRYRTTVTPAADVLAAVHDAGLKIVDLTTEQSDLEDVFLELTRAAGGPASR
ncbi:MAG: ABC transporter ATP-binding protein [Alphaproteobacteria bacterium]